MINNSTTTCPVCNKTYQTGDTHSCYRTVGAARTWIKCKKCQSEYPSDTEYICQISTKK